MKNSLLKKVLILGIIIIMTFVFCSCMNSGSGDDSDKKPNVDQNDYVFSKTSDNTELKDMMQDLQFNGNIQGSSYNLRYRLYIPENYDSNKKYPLVTFYHGLGECGNDNVKHLNSTFKFLHRILNSENLKNYPCIVFAPQCAGQNGDFWVNDGQTWMKNKGYDIKNTKISRSMEASIKIIDSIIDNYSVDVERLYVTGLSLGGLATWDAIARNPGKFACGMPVCGASMPIKNANNFKNIDIWAFHGSVDGLIFPFTTQSMVTAIKSNGGRALYTEYEGVEHNAWTYAYDEENFLDFMFSSKRGVANKYFESE